MPLNELETIRRRVMTLFLLVDTSGSMDGTKIGAVNSAIEEMRPLLQEVSDENADAEIKIAVLEFSTGCNWVTSEPQSLETFFWNDLKAGGITDMGAAFEELESKLSKEAFMKSAMGAYAPVIILLSDGLPTDDWEKGLNILKNNNWYRNASKIAIAVEDADMSILSAFTGSMETVVQVNGDGAVLKKLLSKLAVVSSTMQSRSKPISDIAVSDEENARNIAEEAMRTAISGMEESQKDDLIWIDPNTDDDDSWNNVDF